MKSAAEEYSNLIANIPLFANLEKAAIHQLAAAAHAQHVSQGEFIFFQDDPAIKMFVLTKGRLKLTQAAPDGQQVLMRVLVAPSLFGAVAMVEDETYPVTAQAMEDGQVLYWTKQEMAAIVERFPKLATNTMRFMAATIQEFQERYRQLATERVERRLAHAVIRLARQAGKKTEEGILINLPITRQDLAEMTGTTLFTVSRTLSQWEAQGLVSLGRERIIVKYPHGLVAIAEDIEQGK